MNTSEKKKEKIIQVYKGLHQFCSIFDKKIHLCRCFFVLRKKLYLSYNDFLAQFSFRSSQFQAVSVFGSKAKMYDFQTKRLIEWYSVLPLLFH